MSDTRNVLLLDLDNTLLNTPLFWEDLTLAVAEIADVPASRVSGSAHRYSVGEGLDHYTDFDAMMADLGLEASVATRQLLPRMVRGNYLMSDAQDFLMDGAQLFVDWDVALLTFGQSRLQLLKRSCCPELRALPMKVVQQRKASFIREQLPGCRGALVDDKADQNLPDGWVEVHIDRSPGADCRGHCIRSMTQLNPNLCSGQSELRVG